MATGRIPTTANSPLTVKGDLFGYSTTQARVPVGNDGETLVADSSATTGLRYNPSQAAGKNAIINGAFDIWQRGTTSGTQTIAKIFTADRFHSETGNGALSYTVTQSTDKPDGFSYSLKYQRTAGNTQVSELYLYQDIDTFTSIPYAGKTITFSFYAKKGANYSQTNSRLNVTLRSGTGTDQSQYYASYTGQVNVISTFATLTTSWQRFTYTGTVGATATELGIGFNYTAQGTAGADDSFFVTGIQVELGSTATTFSRAGGTIQGELAACQRYYYRAATTALNTPIGNAFYYSATSINLVIPFPVTMRVSPTIDQATGTDYFQFLRNGAADTFNSFTLDQVSPTAISIYNNTQASGTAGQAGMVFTNNASAYLAFTSEL
jgi:hypothetical protein